MISLLQWVQTADSQFTSMDGQIILQWMQTVDDKFILQWMRTAVGQFISVDADSG